MALNQVARRAAERVRDKIETARPGRLLDTRIFGSVARGESRDESDLDLLLLVDRVDQDLRDAVYRATGEVEAELGYRYPISPCLMPRAHFQELLDRELLFATEV